MGVYEWGGWIDLISSIPALPFLRCGRTARLIRLLRLLRAFKSLLNICRFSFKPKIRGTILRLNLVLVLPAIFAAITILFCGKRARVEHQDRRRWPA